MSFKPQMDRTMLAIGGLWIVWCFCGCASVPPSSGCGVHNSQFRRGSVPVTYGLVRLPPDHVEAREVLFPHANSVEYGGCLIGVKELLRKKTRVWYCPECREAEAKWKSRETACEDGKT